MPYATALQVKDSNIVGCKQTVTASVVILQVC